MTEATIETQDTSSGLLSAAQVCGMAQITYRNLDYWLRCDFIDLDPEHVGSTTPGSGVPRRFTQREAQRFTLLGALVRGGLAVNAAAKIVRALEANGFRPVPLTDGVWMTVDVRYVFT